jgi:hypothetical protein
MRKGYVAALSFVLSTTAYAGCQTATVEVLPFNVQTDFTKSYQQLQDLASNSREVGAVITRSSVYVSKDGCSAVVGYKEPVLYVSRELRRDPCAFQHVLEHEQHHVSLYQRNLQGIDARIKARAAAGEDLFQAAKAEVLAVQAEHQAFDSDEEYESNRTACEGKVARLALSR